jgi:predicted HTH transcriptional regulator
MSEIIFLLIGFGVGYWFSKRRFRDASVGIIKVQESSKKENLEKIREFMINKDKVTNNDIEDLLGVSDATATNYLQELENRGEIRQIGSTGRSVHYKLNG